MATIRKNERSWAIELISQINQFVGENDLFIKRAGGESTVSESGEKMFPDVLLYGDLESSSILQGWELKMPDVPIDDSDFVIDAQRKSKVLGLNSFVVWNFTYAKLFIYDDKQKEFQERKIWHNPKINTREDVKLYRTIWEKTLKDVVLEVNTFLIKGELRKIFIGDVLTRNTITALVNEHKSMVAYELKKNAINNAIIEAFLDNWWKEIKIEYEGDESDKYSAYAKSIIINWANRIIFAHMIKRLQNVAFAIDDLSFKNTPNDGNKIFQNITQKSDFFNIFVEIEYNTLIPPQTWYSLVELSLLLKDSPIKNINQRILQQVLEGSVNESKRLVNGQYTTPPILADILAKITIHDKTGDCFDGCCGTGTIPRSILNLKRDSIGISKAMATTWACDKYQLPLQIANLAMTSCDAINLPCKIFQSDILSLHPDDNVEIINPKTGEKESYSLPLFDAIVSNLPFVKSREIGADESNRVSEIKEKYGLSGRSDFSYYVALHLKDLIKEGGYLGVILSNSFLGTQAGDAFFKTILNYFYDIKIHASGRGRWFDNAEIVTVLLVMRRKTKQNENSNVSFFTWKQSLKEIELHNDYAQTIVNSSLLDKEINPSIVSRVNYSRDELGGLRKLNVSYNSLFTDLKWLLNLSDYIAPVSNYLSVFRGCRRGWDDLFFPNDCSTIEDEFLVDVLTNGRTTNSYIATANRKAFCCNLTMDELSKGGYHGAIKWISRFKDVRNGSGRLLPEVLAKSGLLWYQMVPKEQAEIFTIMNPDDRFFYAKFNTLTFVNQRIIGLRRERPNEDLDLLHALLNSILSIFYIEAIGFGRGLGVLDINKDSIEQSYMLKPELLNNTQIVEIKNKFNSLKQRSILTVEEELDEPIRKEFDLAVLNAYGISNYYDVIKDSIRTMRRMRKAVKEEDVIPIHSKVNIDTAQEDDNVISYAAET